MAFIYRYQIKKKSVRTAVDLGNHKANIEKAIEEEFVSVLKSKEVFKDYFEIRLLRAATDYQLQKLGKRIVRYDTILNSLKTVKDHNSELFQRKANRLFAFIDDYEIDSDNAEKYRVSFECADENDMSTPI